MFPRIDKSEEAVTFYGRVFTEAEKEPWRETLRRGVEGLRNISRATAGEGPTPKFTDNPWAHIVHRAALHVDKKKAQPQANKPEQKKSKASELFGGSKTTTQTAQTDSPARRAFLRISQETQTSLDDRQRRLDDVNRRAQASLRLGGAQLGNSSRPGRPGQPPRPPSATSR